MLADDPVQSKNIEIMKIKLLQSMTFIVFLNVEFCSLWRLMYVEYEIVLVLYARMFIVAFFNNRKAYNLIVQQSLKLKRCP